VAVPHDESVGTASLSLDASTSELAAEPFEEGLLRRRLAERRLGIHIIQAPQREQANAGHALDGARKEALEALGYL